MSALRQSTSQTTCLRPTPLFNWLPCGPCWLLRIPHGEIDEVPMHFTGFADCLTHAHDLEQARIEAIDWLNGLMTGAHMTGLAMTAEPSARPTFAPPATGIRTLHGTNYLRIYRDTPQKPQQQPGVTDILVRNLRAAGQPDAEYRKAYKAWKARETRRNKAREKGESSSAAVCEEVESSSAPWSAPPPGDLDEEAALSLAIQMSLAEVVEEAEAGSEDDEICMV